VHDIFELGMAGHDKSPVKTRSQLRWLHAG